MIRLEKKYIINNDYERLRFLKFIFKKGFRNIYKDRINFSIYLDYKNLKFFHRFRFFHIHTFCRSGMTIGKTSKNVFMLFLLRIYVRYQYDDYVCYSYVGFMLLLLRIYDNILELSTRCSRISILNITDFVNLSI